MGRGRESARARRLARALYDGGRGDLAVLLELVSAMLARVDWYVRRDRRAPDVTYTALGLAEDMLRQRLGLGELSLEGILGLLERPS